MIKIESIKLSRAEGNYEDLFTVECTSFEQSSKAIMLMAQSAPLDGSYDKVDFLVTWEDGREYRGRLDLQYRMVNGYDLRNHMRNHMKATIPYLTDDKKVIDTFITKYLGLELKGEV